MSKEYKWDNDDNHSRPSTMTSNVSCEPDTQIINVNGPFGELKLERRFTPQVPELADTDGRKRTNSKNESFLYYDQIRSGSNANTLR